MAEILLIFQYSSTLSNTFYRPWVFSLQVFLRFTTIVNNYFAVTLLDNQKIRVFVNSKEEFIFSNAAGNLV